MNYLKICSVAFVLCTSGVTYAKAECGDVSIAAMSWQSADALANVDALILEKGFGCTASVILGDTIPTITSMVEKEQPDILSEATITLLPDVAKRGLEEGRVKSLGHPIPEGTVEGWHIPKYLADAHPDIKTVADALRHPELFPAPEDPSKGAILSGPQSWGSTVVAAQLFKAFEAEKKGFINVDAGSAAGLDGAISKAYERKEGFLTYYWSPTSLMGKYPMVRLEGGVPRDEEEWARCTTVASCGDPKPNYWVAGPVDTLVSSRFEKRPGIAPVIEYLTKRSWTSATVSELMVWMTDNQATGEDGARHFLETRPDLWRKWVPQDIAEKIVADL
ncbi:glycine betaine ABC transporter substrate-binding protein [Ochrobactrum chromiisoli]|uniref:ABC transporter substrate-binding protein n=1 Tax=Ochrobactrum chromiisoli TaxID=2993941 RepID=A0ABT3QSJ4_9HYPH|nr:glycine betaine ABC transporter substrate-binding protein [Ochrobactrum chromiisoli]MCX2698590.1 ABC transporter substrate-binding protein [Ochrobactrum chromiisoli]